MIVVDGEPLGSIVVADLPGAEAPKEPAGKTVKAPPAPPADKPVTGSEVKG